MRGVYTPVTKIRRKVFAEVARFAYENKDFSEIDKIPYKIIPGEVVSTRYMNCFPATGSCGFPLT